MDKLKTKNKSNRNNMRKKMNFKKMHSNNVVGYVFISPWLIGFLLFMLFPLIASLYLSFTNYNFFNAPKWIGFENYATMLSGEDGRYLRSLKATFIYVFSSVPLSLASALMVAMILNAKMKFTSMYRTLLYLPSLIGGSVAVAIMWTQLFGESGAVNSILQMIGFDISTSWITYPGTAMWSLVLLNVWKFGSPMLIFLAGLTQIPNSYYESAEIDGANFFHKTWKITLPLLTPIIFFNLVMAIINGFKTFTEGYIITEGGPMDKTLFYALYLYQRAFGQFDMGYGSAMAWVLLIIIAIFTGLVFKYSSAWVYYDSEER